LLKKKHKEYEESIKAEVDKLKVDIKQLQQRKDDLEKEVVKLRTKAGEEENMRRILETNVAKF
jgi:chromosome segregation ATPase